VSEREKGWERERERERENSCEESSGGTPSCKNALLRLYLAGLRATKK